MNGYFLTYEQNKRTAVVTTNKMINKKQNIHR